MFKFLHQHRLHVYREFNGTRQSIPGRYVLSRSETLDTGLRIEKVRFEVAVPDISKPLIIDPVLSYSIYLGGSRFDQGLDIAIDTDGNATFKLSKGKC